MTAEPSIWFGDDETEPGPGAYLVLWYHHDGESHWCSLDQLRERIHVIRETKPDVEERLARLTAVPWSKAVASARKAYNEAVASARKAYNEAVAPAWKAFLAKLHIRRGNAVRIAQEAKP